MSSDMRLKKIFDLLCEYEEPMRMAKQRRDEMLRDIFSGRYFDSKTFSKWDVMVWKRLYITLGLRLKTIQMRQSNFIFSLYFLPSNGPSFLKFLCDAGIRTHDQGPLIGSWVLVGQKFEFPGTRYSTMESLVLDVHN